jgi:hypothetical protein
MAKSKRLIKLLKRITFLEINILPNERLDGSYTAKEQDLIRSFIMLVHAEIEAFIEDKAKEKIKNSLLKWMNYRERSNCLKSVLAFTGNELTFSDKDPKTKDLQFRLNKTVAHYMSSVVDMNHGIKEKNILNILLPLGIELHELDNTWLSTMESFGSNRGKIAHSSTHVLNTLDRNTELNLVKIQILPELEKLDNLIRQLK